MKSDRQFTDIYSVPLGISAFICLVDETVIQKQNKEKQSEFKLPALLSFDSPVWNSVHILIRIWVHAKAVCFL